VGVFVSLAYVGLPEQFEIVRAEEHRLLMSEGGQFRFLWTAWLSRQML